MLTFGSLFAGVGGFDLGLERGGMRCQWQVEIDVAARSVLTRRWPDVPKHADIRDCGTHNLTPVDLICGGFPCQDLSVAGNRAGLSGARSGLFYEMTRIANELRPTFLLWENVPGLLSSRDGRDFLAVLIELERIGYCGCWTVLDAQFFGLAQRRQRVFGLFARRDIGAKRCAEILSLTARLSWNTETRGAKRTRIAAPIRAGSSGNSVNRPGRRGDDDQNIVTTEPYTLDWQAGSSGDTGFRGKARSWITDKPGRARALTANRTLAVCNALNGNSGGADDNMGQAGHIIPVAATLNSGGNHGGFRTEPGEHLVAFALNSHAGAADADVSNRSHANGGPVGLGVSENLAFSLRGGRTQNTAGSFGVRRLTPRECERLQGFPDDWTDGQADAARYRQLGNAVAVPCAEWIGRRVVEAATRFE